jgi:protein TonB
VTKRTFSTLHWALGISIGLHAALLTLRLVDPESFNRVFEDTPLEVILVNARTKEAPPDKAQAIAQTTLAGGGDADKGRATSPLPPAPFTEVGETQDQDAASQLINLQEHQSILLANVKQQLAALAPLDAKSSNKGEAAEQTEKRRQLIKQLAEIERRINHENSRPKKRYISPAVREEAYAVYYDAMRHAIEERGTENFPTAAGKKLYGELTMIITVNFDGRVMDTEVVQSSGNSTLDRRAASIARAAGPYGTFTRAMRNQADQILVVSRFKFTRDETLEAKISTNP